MLDWAYRLALMVDERPLLKWSVIGALAVASLAMWVLRLEAVQQQARRFAYIFRNTLSPEARLNDLTHWFAVSLGAGITLAAGALSFPATRLSVRQLYAKPLYVPRAMPGWRSRPQRVASLSRGRVRLVPCSQMR